jgi:HD-GYP domain-containing protein (c-di-GMP phosphodiesterase class II)
MRTNGKFQIRFHVLSTAFLAAFVIALTMVIIVASYQKFKDLAEENARALFSLIAERNADQLQTMVAGARGAVEDLSRVPPSQIVAQGHINQAAVVPMLLSTLRANPHIYSIHVGLVNGQFLQVIGVHGHEHVATILNTPPDTWFAIRTLRAGQPDQAIQRGYWQFLAMNGEVIGEAERDEAFAPTSRPWYKAALSAPGLTVSHPYVLKTRQDLALTLSEALPGGLGVASADLAVSGFDRYAATSLEGRKGGVVVANDEGSILTSHATAPFADQFVPRLTRAEYATNPFVAEAGRLLRYDGSRIAFVNGDAFAYATRSVQITPGAALHVVAFAPTSLYTGPVDSVRNEIVRLAALMLLVSLPLIYLVSRQIAGELNTLTRESERIEQLDFSGERTSQSVFYEIEALGHAQQTMKTAIRERTQALDEARESQRILMESMLQLIAGAIDAKSAYTGGHCARVPELARMLAEAASDTAQGPLAGFRFETEEQWREFRIGTWLHDCGKVTTPEFVVDKATKLETIYNRIHEVRTRFEILLRDAEILHLNNMLAGRDEAVSRSVFEARRAQLVDDFAFVAKCNIGGESMLASDDERLHGIALQTWVRHFDDRLGLSHGEESRFANRPPVSLPVVENLLADKPEHIVPRTDKQRYDARFGFHMDVPEHLYDFGELHNLCIGRGTLTAEERYKINEHIIQTIVMLDQLPLPSNLKRIPEYASTHHETLSGTGYPRKLAADALSVPARIMAIADIFEALTAADRPYKKAKSLSEAIHILASFKKRKEIDADLFDLFLTSGVYRRYAEAYLHPEQIDEVDVSEYVQA